MADIREKLVSYNTPDLTIPPDVEADILVSEYVSCPADAVLLLVHGFIQCRIGLGVTTVQPKVYMLAGGVRTFLATGVAQAVKTGTGGTENFDVWSTVSFSSCSGFQLVLTVLVTGGTVGITINRGLIEAELF